MKLTSQSIQTYELEYVVKIPGFYPSLDASNIDHVKEMIKRGID
jgi:hypothetical protein